MEAVGAASSIVAVVEITGKVLKICFEYLKEVRHAREEIQNLQTELQQLDTILNNLKARVTGPDSTKFQLSSKLLEEVEIYREKLNGIERQLKPKIKHRIGFRTLKWPFESKEVKSLVEDLHRYRQLFSLALQIDQTDLLLSIDHKLNFSKLPEADGAAFDSYIEGEEAKSLDGTRIELLSHFKQWSDDTASGCVFWLNGVPGTGKSALVRTMAANWNKVGRLSASFFFKRGGGATFLPINLPGEIRIRTTIPHTMNQNLLPHELRSTVTRIAAVLNRNNIDYAIMGGAAICLLGVNIGRSTADVDLVIHVDERAITAEAVSSILLEEKDFKPILQYGVTIPGFCVQRPENNDLVVEIEIFDQLAWPERPQYDLKQASCTTLILDNQEVKIFSPEWLLREKIATYYQRRNSLKSDSDLGDVLDLLEIVVPNSPELDFTNSSELKEALGEFLANAPESRVLVAEKIKF